MQIKELDFELSGEIMNNPTQQLGNKNTDASFFDVCEALKGNIMRTINVAELVTITAVDHEKSIYRCSILSHPEQICECTKLQSLDVQLNDVMLVVFTSSDFRTNLLKVKNEQTITDIGTKTLHSKNYGVLVGLVYRK